MKRMLKSIKNAVNGILEAGDQTNIKLLSVSFLITVVLSVIFRLAVYEWIAVLLISAVVLCLELVNTCLELLCDKVNPDYDKDIGRIKDIAAGAVLLSTFFALLIGLVIFVPKISALEMG